MSQVGTVRRTWSETFTAWSHPKAVAMLFLGFSAGIPILLIFSTLSVWLREAGVERSAVTFFSWAALGYSFKFLWAPLIDLLPLPYLTNKMGRRRSWLLITQVLIIVAIATMAAIDPAGRQGSLTMMAFASVLLGFSSASQDVVIDAYRIECADQSLQALLSSMYIAGYRLGMLAAGAGSLFLADIFGLGGTYSYPAWRTTYFIMALLMVGGVLTTLCITEPPGHGKDPVAAYPAGNYLRLAAVLLFAMAGFATTFFYAEAWLVGLFQVLSVEFVAQDALGVFLFEFCRFLLAGGAALLLVGLAVRLGVADREMAKRAYYAPVRDFFERYGLRTALLFLLLIGCYRLSDIVLGVVSNVFYIDMGFSKSVIATITKSFGLAMTLIGGFLGGILTLRFGIDRILFLGAFLSAATNLLFMLLAATAPNVTLLTIVIAADNLSAGIAATAFVAFLSSLTNISFTAVQYAVFSSMMTLLPKVVGGYSGTMVSAFGYERFFLFTALMGLPVLVLIVIVAKSARH
jgi:MFS transporter, PAT family, beta-lactamase induction signal transducer AmpG